MARYVVSSSYRHSGFLCMVLSMAPLRVGFLGYEQTNALDLVGPAEAFASAFRENGKGKFERCYQVSIIGLTRRSFAAESGIVFQPTATIETVPKLDTLIIPGGCGLRWPDVNRRLPIGFWGGRGGRDGSLPFVRAFMDWRRRDFLMDVA
jgi:hypothetical protein